MNDKEKICKNCNYFSRHYFIFHDYLRPTESGHCLNTKTHYTKTHRKSSTPACENWQPAENNAEQPERIEKTIRNMAKHLSQILLILKSE
ncbi:MAG: hypothetical protein K2L67_03010 [Clostridia bacterium]|nr:hypothetical protein [Clostridia bacterium]